MALTVNRTATFAQRLRAYMGGTELLSRMNFVESGLVSQGQRISALEGAGLPVLAINSVSVSEGNTISFIVTRTGTSAGTSSCTATVTPGTATTPADYTAGTTALTSTVTFAAGETTKTLTFNTTEDTTAESTETFTVVLSNPVNATIHTSQGTGTGTITDDDTAPAGLGGPYNSDTELSFYGAVRTKESGAGVNPQWLGNYNAQNNVGALGAYQFHEVAAGDVGWYLGDSTGWGTPNDWLGLWSAEAQSFGVSSKNTFLGNKPGQDRLFTLWMELNWAYLTGQWDGRDVRPKINAHALTEGFETTVTACLAPANLLGAGGSLEYVLNLVNGGDPFGTSARTYFRYCHFYKSPFNAPNSGPTINDPRTE
jgi:hypothetical protein